MWIFITALISFFVLELIYFKIANHFNIIDKPNLRSSHTQITLRGGGIIFPIAFIIGIIICQPALWIIGLAVLFIATISFLDDILTLNNKLRITIHILSASLLVYQIYLTQVSKSSLLITPYNLLLIPLSLIFIIGIINAYNFMDGINGITVIYSSNAVLSIWYIQNSQNISLLNNDSWFMVLASLIVFGFFNVRKKAVAFAGDIGSISMALILCYLILSLIIITNNYKWLFLLGIYGLDAVGTITCRIIRKENIFEAHRSHFYQFLANEKKWPHVLIGIMYAAFQIILNAVLIASDQIFQIIISYLIIVVLYVFTRLKLEGKKRLFVNYNSV